MAWLSAQELERQYVSVVTMGELHYGVERLPDGNKQRNLRRWIRTIEDDYAGRIVPLDLSVATNWGKLRSASPNTPTVDAQIVATALTFGFTFVTRNEKHFDFDGLKLVNPWKI